MEPANDRKRCNLHKCNLGIIGSVDVDQGSPTKSICGPRGEFKSHTPTNVSERSQEQTIFQPRLGLLQQPDLLSQKLCRAARDVVRSCHQLLQC